MKFINLTDKENQFMMAHLSLAHIACGAETIEQLTEDNYSWATVSELSEKTGFNKHQISGIISSLTQKNIIISDTADSLLLVINEQWLNTLNQSLKTGI